MILQIMSILKVRASNYLAHFKFNQVENLQSISLPEAAHFVL